jgi:hypothetical protein
MSQNPSPPVAGGVSRSIAGQTLDQLGGRLSILARQRADHQRLDRLMTRARETVADGDEREHARVLRALAPPGVHPRLRRPTRPHRVVSRRPPGQTLSALPLTVLDRSRDQLQRLDERTGHRFSARLSSADRVLAAAAGAVEQLPIMPPGSRVLDVTAVQP